MNNLMSLNRSVDVFISYSSKDENIANMVVEGLSERGVKCWKAGTYTINSGEDFRQKIAEALDESKIFLIILSEHSMSSPWVKLELTEALYKNKKIYSLKIDNYKIDELFEFKLGCSQTSDGTQNIVAVVENLAINIKKDRDAQLEKEKTKIYSDIKSYHFFNLSFLNNILISIYALITAFRVVNAYNSALEWESPLAKALDAAYIFVLMLMCCIFLNLVFWEIVKKYAQLGCPSAEYLMFKKKFSIFSFPKTKKQAIIYLQNSAKSGDHRALYKLSKILKDGKFIQKDEKLSDEYHMRASCERKLYKKKVVKNKRSLVLFILSAILLVLVYVYIMFIYKN